MYNCIFFKKKIKNPTQLYNVNKVSIILASSTEKVKFFYQKKPFLYVI